MVINSHPRFWLQDPTKLPGPPQGKSSRKLWNRALLDLAEIQACIRSGELDEDAVEIATKRCELGLHELKWSASDLLTFILELRPYSLTKANDFKGAEWCKDRNGDWHACDAYAASFDTQLMRRDPKGVSIYVKFSVPTDGECLLITIGAHD